MSDTPTDPELPRAVALAWGVAANPQRGPKRELSIERIVDVAVDLADRGGLGAVSMAAVASELGFTPMSLYRYVTSKDDLLVLMQERGIGLPPESVVEAEAEAWRAGLREWAAATLATYREHPWLLDLAIDGTPQTPNNLAWLDAALEALAEAPADYEAKVAIVLAVIAQVRWQGVVERGYLAAAAAASVAPDVLDSRASDVIATFITPEAYPQVHAALHAGVFGPGPDDPFAFGLERVLDGIESYLATEPSARPATPLGDPEEERVARDPKVKEAVKARREAEKHLREARKRERERVREARERMRRA